MDIQKLNLFQSVKDLEMKIKVYFQTKCSSGKDQWEKHWLCVCRNSYLCIVSLIYTSYYKKTQDEIR
jgi:hypothetical protein